MKNHKLVGMFKLLLVSAILSRFVAVGTAATLVNRWSFNETSGTVATDSVSGANAILTNGAAFNGAGQATLSQIYDGDPSADTNGQYIALPPNILGNYTAVTVEAWVTPTLNASGNSWARVWDFGNSSGSYSGSYKVGPGDLECRFGNASPYADPVFCEFWSATNGDYWNRSTAQMNDGAENHVVWTGDAATHVAKLYLNGALVSTVYNFSNSPAVMGSTTNDWLGRSQYGSDPLANGSYDEFRIYNGAISALEVAADYQNGPDGAPGNYGTVTNIVLQVASPGVGYTQTAQVLAGASGLTNQAVDIYDDPGVTYVSGNTNILTVDAHGVVTGVAAGTTTLVADYGTLSSTQSVTVSEFQPVLLNRYSFNGTPGDTVAHDSVGGADGTLMGDAAYDGNGQVDLDGTSGTYVDLPAGLISQTNIASGAVTLMGWATIDPSNQKWDYLYAFGNISGLAGAPNTPGLEFLIMTPYNGGGNGQFAAGYVGENWTTFSPNLLGQTNVQVTLVFNSNPTRDFLGCYVNGVLANWTHTTVPFSSIADDYSYLGHSLYGNDPYMIGSIREFRIYNGELAPFQIAAAYQAGPDNTNFLTGTPTGLALNPGSQPIAAGDQRVVQALMNFTQVSNVVVNGGSTLTFISSDPSVATVDNQGLLTALKLGSATITATYGYVSTGTTNYFTNSTAVSVFNDYPATLMHRYSFTSNADDSVGGANGTLAGSANVANGQLVLPNTTSVSPAADYLQLPPGILTNDVNGIATTNAAFSTLTTLVAGSYTTNYNDPAVTIEAWATLAPNQYTWAALYNFGVQDSSGHAAYDLICQANNAGTRTMAKISDSDDDNQHNDAALAPPVLQAQTNIYIATVFDPSAGYVAIYTNGVLMAENYQATITMAGVLGDRNIIGADNWPDAGLQGSIDEFRIWNGVLHPSEIAQDYQLGPNVLPTIAPAGPMLHATVSSGQLVISWATNGAAAFTLQSSPTLGSGTTWTAVSGTPTVVGSNYQVNVPITNSVQFYELKQ